MWEEFLGIEAEIDFSTSLGDTFGTKGLVFYSDASRKGLGYVLMQNRKVIAYASRQLK